MKFTLPLKLATLATVTFTSLIPFNSPAKASAFEEQALDQENVIAIARPYGEGKYDLLVIEQIPDKQECWTESGSNPTLVDPLLLNFDFTGICRRATDSNGYSIRVDGNDLGLDYLLRLVPRDGELVLVGTPRTGNYQEIVLGSTQGLASGFMKVILNPGWQFTKRAYQGKVLGHFYVSGTQAAITGGEKANKRASNPEQTATPVTTTQTEALFSDLSGNVYQPQVEKAVAMGVVEGFEDNTFRPQEAITREQLIVMAVDALGKVAQVNLDERPQGEIVSFKDVSGDRPTAKKIKWAQWNFLNLGEDTLQPTEAVTRAELIDTMRRVALHLKSELNLPQEIQQNQEPMEFSDISGNWAQSAITEMSGYCGVATPLNEEGTEFAPDRKATRDYTAAVLVRVIDCVKAESQQASSTTKP